MTSTYPTDQEIDSYITTRASLYGINPVTALRVRHAEMPTLSKWVGDQGTSFGPFQLHVNKGLGDEFQRTTGLNVTDPSTWHQQVDFALQSASQQGWTPFHAAANIGIATWEGISQGANNVVSTLRYYFPVVGYSGNPTDTYHTPGATDLFAPEGTNVRAIVQGTVVNAGWDRYGGNTLLERGADGLMYYYAHLRDAVSLTAGDSIAGGGVIGHVGHTGNADTTGSHLHIGIGSDIATGTGANGGTGTNFDAQHFLSNLLHIAGSGNDPAHDAATGSQLGFQFGTNPVGTTLGWVSDPIGTGLSDIHQNVYNYVQNRATSIILLGLALLLIIGGVIAVASKSETVRMVAATAIKSAI